MPLYTLCMDKQHKGIEEDWGYGGTIYSTVHIDVYVKKRKKRMNLSFSSNHPGTIRPIIQIVLVHNS